MIMKRKINLVFIMFAVAVLAPACKKKKSLMDLIWGSFINGLLESTNNCPSGCTPGYAVYGYMPGEYTPSPLDPGDPGPGSRICQWHYDPSRSECGKNAHTPAGGPFCVFCRSLGPNALGFDEAPRPILPSTIISVYPSQDDLFEQHGEIRVEFDRTMDSATVCISGEGAEEASKAYYLTKTSEFNDTLVIPPTATWTVGHRYINIKVSDNSGLETALNVNFRVRDLNAEQSAAESAIAERRAGNGSLGWDSPSGPVVRIGSSGYFQQDFPVVFPPYPLGAATQGRIIYSPGNGAFLVYGAILEAYLALGGAEGPLGPPITDEFDAAILVRRSNFLNGYIEKPFISGPVVGYD